MLPERVQDRAFVVEIYFGDAVQIILRSVSTIQRWGQRFSRQSQFLSGFINQI